MKQIVQNLKSGKTNLIDVPIPDVMPGHLLVSSVKTLISPGTERMLLEFGKANLAKKALLQPERVKDVINKLSTDGIVPTIERVFSKLDAPLPLGYCNVGIVAEVGEGVKDFQVGDRVVSNGYHAEYINVPKNLCSKIPAQVADEDAVFCILASIGLQAVRLCEPTIGENIAVFGLGLVGLSCAQLLKANGCDVICLDYNEDRLKLAEKIGASIINLSQSRTPATTILNLTKGYGVDASIIATATKSNEPIQLASEICRQRGRVILVGESGLKLNRTSFYKKELSFQVSASYGPGRYDKSYEEDGIDYPYGLVRWTENRNFQAVLTLMKERKIKFSDYITHKFDIENAILAYEQLSSSSKALGVMLCYNNISEKQQKVINLEYKNNDKTSLLSQRKRQTAISFVGAGNHANSVLLPAFKACNVKFQLISSKNGLKCIICWK